MYRLRYFLITALLLGFTACSWGPRHCCYQDCYAYLQEPIPDAPMVETDYYLVMLANARHLDYSDGQYFLRTVSKHPSDGSKNGDVGHSWFILHGIRNGEEVTIEGGHSGETGVAQAKYFEGVLNNYMYGVPDPTPEQQKHPTHNPDPISYLWEPQHDGYFQYGNGGHRPTFAAKIDLTKEQFDHLLAFVDPHHYDYSEYSITGKQCSTLLAAIAKEIDFKLEHQVVLSFDDTLDVGGTQVKIWSDPKYSQMTISTPDMIERGLMTAVREGRAQNAMGWYEETHPKPTAEVVEDALENVYRFPERLGRMLLFW